jgi:hypothetical protein
VTAMVIMRNGYVLSEEDIRQCLVDAGVESFKWIRGGVKFVKQGPILQNSISADNIFIVIVDNFPPKSINKCIKIYVNIADNNLGF